MKIVVVSCLREDKTKALQLMENTGLSWIYFVDSIDYMTGQKNDMAEAWFSIEKEFSESVILFSIADEAKAADVIEAVEIHNKENVSMYYPLKGFVVPLDKWSNTFAFNTDKMKE